MSLTFTSLLIYLLPIFSEGPHQFVLQITGSIIKCWFPLFTISFQWKCQFYYYIFSFLSILFYSIHFPYHLMHFLFNLFFFINFLLLVNRSYVFSYPIEDAKTFSIILFWFLKLVVFRNLRFQDDVLFPSFCNICQRRRVVLVLISDHRSLNWKS